MIHRDAGTAVLPLVLLLALFASIRPSLRLLSRSPIVMIGVKRSTVCSSCLKALRLGLMMV